MTAYGRPHDDDVGRPDTPRLVLELLRQALELLDDNPGAGRCRVEDAFALLSESSEPKRTKHRALAQWKIRKAEEYINAHLGACLRIQDVARLVDMSTGYFSRAFKKAFGASYSEYVTKNRLDLAKRAAPDVGFVDRGGRARLWACRSVVPHASLQPYRGAAAARVAPHAARLRPAY
ncbi:helix-turn-helix transcriptional regulator [Bradyrhizobium sp. 83002]|nr:AraC family transcriptional regulator [Bradyrhizobium aeschynomenes]NPU09697.1 helix-turn-helix transcriptional regulator [Bradyrhizobium aeschynomenes]